MASTSGLFVVFHGAEGLRSLARAAHHRAVRLRDNLVAAGWTVINDDRFFDTLTISTEKIEAQGENDDFGDL